MNIEDNIRDLIQDVLPSVIQKELTLYEECNTCYGSGLGSRKRGSMKYDSCPECKGTLKVLTSFGKEIKKLIQECIEDHANISK